MMSLQSDDGSERPSVNVGPLQGDRDLSEVVTEAGLSRVSNWKEWIGQGNRQPFNVLVVSHGNMGHSAVVHDLEMCDVQVIRAETGAQAISRLRRLHFDMMFTSLSVPGVDVFNLLRAAQNIFPEIEMYVVTPHEMIRKAVECIRRGAEGFIVEPDLGEQIAIAVKKAKHRKRLRLLAYTDGLTSLFNRDMFNQFLMHECRRSARRGYPLALLILDIDYFKEYNDLNGHLIGDVALIKMGRLIRQSTRASDIPARYGGDEFAVILTEISLPEALARADRIRELICQTPFQHERNIPGSKLTASFGMALYPEHGPAFAQLISSADRALYQAKADGRNRICVFEKGMGEKNWEKPQKASTS